MEMLDSVYVDNFSYALGENVCSVEESSAAGRTISSASLLREAGFTKHHMCGPESSAYSMARQSVEQIRPELQEVNAIVYSTCLPINGSIGSFADFERTRDVKHLMNFAASNLQSDFGLNEAQVFGLSQQACTGMLGSVRMANMLLQTEPQMKQVLCVTADRFPPTALYEQAYNLISDGAASCIVSKEPKGFKLLGGYGITNGAMSFASDDETVGSFFNYSYDLINKTLQRVGRGMQDIDWIVPQNTNAKAWQILSSILRFPFEKVCFPTLPEVGHVISGDNIINLAELCKAGKIQTGERLLLFMAGYGLNWQCIVLEKVRG